MRTPRFWTNTVILPEADIAIGPLPLPGLDLIVHSGREAEISGHGFSYRFRAPGFSDLDHAERWLSQDFARLGFGDLRWEPAEDSRVFVARRERGARSARIGWVTHANDDGQITVVEATDAAVEDKDDLLAQAKTVLGVSEMWLHAFEHPDDALAHAHLRSEGLDLSFDLPAGMVPRAPAAQ